MNQRRTLLALLALLPLLIAASVGLPALAERGTTVPASGTWTEDLFGTGEFTRIDYSATMTGDEIALDISSVEAPAGVTYRIDDPDDQDRNDDRDGNGRSKDRADEVKIEIEFTRDASTVEVKIKAKIKDGEPQVEVKYTRKTWLLLPAPVGYEQQTWSGTLCMGETFTIDFTVDNGTVSITDVVGPPSRVEHKGRHGRVYFDDFNARIDIKTKKDGIRIHAKLGRCGQPYETTTTNPADTTTTTAPMPTYTVPTTAAPTTYPPDTMPPTTMTTMPATTATTAPPTTPPPTEPPTTQPPTTIPQKKYLAYNIPGGGGEIVVEFDNPAAALSFWAVNTNQYDWYTKDQKTPSELTILLRDRATRDNYEFDVTVVNGSPVATYAPKNGTPVTLAPASESTTAPPMTAPSFG